MPLGGRREPVTDNLDSTTPLPAVPYARFTQRLHALALDALLYLGVIILMVLGGALLEGAVIGARAFFGSVLS